MTFSKNKGFTIIEVMVVIIIIAMLAVWGIGQYIAHYKKAKLVEAKSVLLENADFLAQYYLHHVSYANTNQDGCARPALPITQTAYFDITFGYCNPERYTLYARPNKTYKKEEKRYIKMDESNNITLCTPNADNNKDHEDDVEDANNGKVKCEGF